MQNGKSPGNDGLSKEFYVCFFSELGDLLVNTLSYSFKCGELTTSQKHAIITLIEKKDRDKKLIKNWRPISLLNVNVKIASKAMALTIKRLIHKLVHCDQTAYVQGRNIVESIRVIDDILEYVDKINEEGILFAVDIEKAFDSVHHSSIFAILKSLGLVTALLSGLRGFLTIHKAV